LEVCKLVLFSSFGLGLGLGLGLGFGFGSGFGSRSGLGFGGGFGGGFGSESSDLCYSVLGCCNRSTLLSRSTRSSS
jgi:hypothetical protein